MKSVKQIKRSKRRKCRAHNKLVCTDCNRTIQKGKGVYDLCIKYEGGNFERLVFCSKDCRKKYIEKMNLE